MDYQSHSGQQHQPPLYSEKIISDRKIFFLDLKENNRGKFVKITEDVKGRRDTIMIPIEALAEFYDALGRVVDESGVEFDDDEELDEGRDDD
jgi:hypothetical protein